MSWRGVNGAGPSLFAAPDLPLDAPLPTGTVLLEIAAGALTGFLTDPQAQPTNLLRHSARLPWPSNLTLRLSPTGALTLLTRQGEQTRADTLEDAISTEASAIITYGWNAPARFGYLSVWQPDLHRIRHLPLRNPLPLCWRDAKQMFEQPFDGLSHLAHYAAIADHLSPAGPLPDLAGETQISTPQGAVQISCIRPGSRVDTADGIGACVISVINAHVPARGTFETVELRYPYLGLQEDINLSASARLLLSGCDVEYFFGQLWVSVTAAQLCDGVTAALQTPAPNARPSQLRYALVLDRPAAIIAAGALIESYDLTPLMTCPAALEHSVVAGLALPQLTTGADSAPQLRDYEALTLRQARAA